MPKDRYESPLASRYASDFMLCLFSPDTRFQTWRRLWVALARAEHNLGLPVTAEQVAELEAHITDIDYEKAAQWEKKLRHDVMAHVHTYGELCPKAMPIIHLGATSCYVTDNADLIIYREGLRYLRGELLAVVANLSKFAEQYKATPTLGYTHYQPAQLVTVGKRATLWMQDLLSDLEELDFVLDHMKFLGCRGTTGTEASFMDLFEGDEAKIDEMNRRIAAEFGFDACFTVCGQTYPRKVDARILNCLSSMAQSVYRMANDIRLLQHDRQLKLIAANLGKKIKSELTKLMTNDREKYEQFHAAFGMVLRAGAVTETGDKVDEIKDLLLYHTSETKLVSLKEYVDAMPAEQTKIYFACGDNVKRLLSLPQAEQLRDKGFDVLCMTSQIDEYFVDTMKSYDDKPFCNIATDDLGLESEEEKKETEAKQAEDKELLDFVKETLGEQVASVRLSNKLVSSAVCLSTEGGVTLEMERYFRSMPGAPTDIRAVRVLELNANHHAYQTMKEAFTAGDKDKAARIAKILHAQALLIAGEPLEDPAAYSELVCTLI